MSTSYYRNEVEPSPSQSPFLSTGRPGPPPPSTPYFTKKLLTMVSSGNRNDGNGDNNSIQHRSSLPSPATSPADSVAQAMKNDLEELIGYIDGLAFEKMDEKVNTMTTSTRTSTSTRTPSTNKQLFSTSDITPFPDDKSSYDERVKVGDLNLTRKAVFRDRTNRFGADADANVGQKHNTPGKLGDPEVPIATSHTKTTKKPKTPLKNLPSSVDSILERMTTPVEQQQPKMLEPAGSPPAREEPAGSPPPQEASLYFHDESLSLILSQTSEDTDDNDSGVNVDVDVDDDGDDHLDSHRKQKTSLGQDATTGSERPTRLLSTFQKNGLIPSPAARAKTISFLAVSKDPTPSKSRRSTSTSAFNSEGGHIHIATPARPDSNPLGSNDDDDDNELDSNSALRRTDLESRKGTPYPSSRDRDPDRLEQDNKDRKGNEWWRSVPLENPARRTISFLPDSKDGSSSSDENIESKSLKWEAGITTPFHRRHGVAKGTPIPFGRRHDCRNFDDGDDHIQDDSSVPQSTTIPETPVPHLNKQSNLVLTSPESAKKLLQTAIDALKDARQERDAARQWANDIKESVNEWVEDQRRLIRTESASISGPGSNSNSPVSTEFLQQQHQAIEDLINNLRHEIKTSKYDTETQLQTMLMKQDEQIRELSRQLTGVKEQLSCVVREGTSEGSRTTVLGSRNHIDPNQSHKASRYSNSNNDAPGSMHKTPKNNTTGLTRSASRSETSNASSRGSHRIRRSTPSGGHLIDYGNGVTKELHPDGTTVTRFQNGDVETRFGANANTNSSHNTASSSPSSSSCALVAYYHSKEEVLQITQRDGSVLYEYASGQVERHCADGVKIILFPDGTKSIV